MTNNLNSISNKLVIILWICMKRTWSEVYSPSPKQDTLSPLFPRFLSKETHWINHFYNNKHFKLIWDLKEPKSKAKTTPKNVTLTIFILIWNMFIDNKKNIIISQGTWGYFLCTHSWETRVVLNWASQFKLIQVVAHYFRAVDFSQ